LAEKIIIIHYYAHLNFKVAYYEYLIVIFKSIVVIFVSENKVQMDWLVLIFSNFKKQFYSLKILSL